MSDLLESLAAIGETICENQNLLGLAEVRAHLIQKQPAFASLLFGLSRHVFVEGDVITTAATDGKHIVYSVECWRNCSLTENVFITAHEICHLILMHPSRMRSYKDTGIRGRPLIPKLYNDAGDYVINDMLINAKCGTMPEAYPGLHDTSIGTAQDSVEDVYCRLYDALPPPEKGKGDQPGNGGGSPADGYNDEKGKFDGVLPPSQEAPARAQVDREVATAIAVAKAQGTAPAALVRMFERVLEPQVDWRFLLRQAFHSARGRNRSTWRRLNRRFLPQGVILPGRDGTALGTVVVAFDTSGSVSQSETEAYLGEACSILEETRPKELWAVPCDARVYSPIKLTEPRALLDFAKRGGLKGGGGTSFKPVFAWVEDNNIRPEVMIYLTDMYGSFPHHAPRFPVIWVSTGGTKAPFGRVIKLDSV